MLGKHSAAVFSLFIFFRTFFLSSFCFTFGLLPLEKHASNIIILNFHVIDFLFRISTAPIAIQTNPNPWPIVEPVFHFGAGFDHQHYCPTHSQGPQPHEYIVFFHVNAGVSITFQISGNREVIRGK